MPVPSSNDQAAEEDDDAKMIAKLMQEDLDAMEAQNIVNEPESSAFDEDYVVPSNVRPPTDIYED